MPPPLFATPDLLDAVVAEVPPEFASIRAANGGFALVEHVHHLADFEVEGFGLRIERVATEDLPLLLDFDGDATAVARRYLELPVAPSVARFRAARTANLARLADLDPARGGVQQGVGPVTLADLARRMVDHDRAHFARLADLLRSLTPGSVAPLARIDAFVQVNGEPTSS